MFGRATTHLIVAIAVVALTAGMVTVTPASANSKGDRILAGLVIGGIIGAAIGGSSHNDRPSYGYSYGYAAPCPPVQVYDPYPYYTQPSGYYYAPPPPRPVYCEPYGFSGGYGPGRQYRPEPRGYRPPPPSYRPHNNYRPPSGPRW